MKEHSIYIYASLWRRFRDEVSVTEIINAWMVLAGFVGGKKFISGLPVPAPDTMALKVLTYFSYAYLNADAVTNTCINTSLVVLSHVAFLLQQPRTSRSATNPEGGKNRIYFEYFPPFHFSTYKIKFCQKYKRCDMNQLNGQGRPRRSFRIKRSRKKHYRQHFQSRSWSLSFCRTELSWNMDRWFRFFVRVGYLLYIQHTP